jgi:ribonuclease VapC
MSKVVLDASALLALLNQEPGAQKLTPELLREATASTVNLAEVQTKLVREGGDPDEAWELALAPISEAEPFTNEHAKIAGTLVRQTRPLGLSLGDRACLALAMTLGAPVYTTDKDWKNLKLGVPIHVLR